MTRSALTPLETLTAAAAQPVAAQVDALRLALNVISLAACYVDRDERYIIANAAFCAWLGRPRHEIEGFAVRDVVRHEIYERAHPHFQMAFQGTGSGYDREQAGPDGTRRWSHIDFFPHRGPSGEVVGLIALIEDIQHLKELEFASVARENQLKLVTDNIRLPISRSDRNLHYSLVNRPVCEWFGFSEAEILGRHWSAIIGEDQFEQVRPYAERALAGEFVTYERHARFRARELTWIRVHMIPERDQSGEVVGLYVVIVDMDAEYQLRESLAARERRLKVITDNIGVPIGYVDRDMRMRFVNRPSMENLGLTEEQILGRHLRELFGQEVFEFALPYFERALNGATVSYERLARFINGESWIRTTLVPDINPDGTVAGMFTVVHNIDSDYRRQLELQSREHQLRAFTSNIPGSIAYLDTERRYRFVNNTFLQLHGKSLDEVIGKTSREVLGEEVAAQIKPYTEPLHAGKTTEYERLITLPSGEQRWRHVRLVPDFDEQGALRGTYVVGNDIHDLKTAQAALQRSEAEMSHALESLPYPMAYVDRTMRYQYVNRVTERYSGKSREEVIGKDLAQVFGQDRFDEIKPLWDRALAGESFELERLIRNVDGKSRWVVSRFTPRFDEAGLVIGFYSSTLDIDDLKRAELELRHANSMLLSHFENTPLAVIEINRANQVLRWSPQAEKMFGWSLEELQGMPPDAMGLVYHEDKDLVRSIHQRLMSGAERRLTSLNRNVRKDGRIIWCEWYNSSLVDDSGQVLSILSLGQDVTGRVLAEERLQHMATHDTLTGLPNRAMLQDRLRQAIARARRAGSRVCALFIDLDRFKEVNDTLGHRVGDELLREMSVRLGRIVREADLLVRLSGDEFMVVLEQVTDFDAPRLVAQKLLDEIRAPSRIEGHEIYVSASVGISIFPDDGDEAETLIRNADLAMYRAKEMGKNNWQMFSPDMAERGIEMRLLENALRSAIGRQELELYYQPVVSMVDNSIIGAEALLRWHHPTRGMLTPGHFIHLAEETGLVHDIGNWVLDAALAQHRLWTNAGLGNLRMAINLSAGQFRAAQLADRVKEKIRLAGCDPHQIELEVTETSMLRDPEGVGHVLTALRETGVRVAIDDFGTGYSSLSHLKRFPIDTLKVDRSFVTDAVTDSGDAAIVTAVIALGRALGLEVVAEGVETVAQRKFLAARGCDNYQGYLVSRPLPAAEFAELVRSSSVARGT